MVDQHDLVAVLIQVEGALGIDVPHTIFQVGLYDPDTVQLVTHQRGVQVPRHDEFFVGNTFGVRTV